MDLFQRTKCLIRNHMIFDINCMCEPLNKEFAPKYVLYLCMCVFLFIYMYVCACVPVCMCVCVCACVCACARVFDSTISGFCSFFLIYLFPFFLFITVTCTKSSAPGSPTNSTICSHRASSIRRYITYLIFEHNTHQLMTYINYILFVWFFIMVNYLKFYFYLFFSTTISLICTHL